MASASELDEARWVYEVAVHPVLQEPIPSIFRASSFMPVTVLCAAGLVSARSSAATLYYHWAYQSHSAAVRYCNYADESRPLDAQRMLAAYAASTAAAWGIGLGALALVRRVPRLGPLGAAIPHTALATAGALSTVLNNEADLTDGVAVTDASGTVVGESRLAARAGVQRATLLQAGLIPSCALLFPMVAMRHVVAPKLITSVPHLLPLTSFALVIGGVCVLTPLVVAAVPATISLQANALEPEFLERAHTLGVQPSQTLYSSRVLY